MIFLAVVTSVLLIIVASVRPNKSEYSDFEMHRRLEEDTKHVDTLNWRRYEYFSDVMTLLRILTSLLVVLSTVSLIAAEGWLWGIIFAFVLALFYKRIARLSVVHRWFQYLYDKFETQVLYIVERMSRVLRIVGGLAETGPNFAIASRQELVHLVDTAGNLLTKNEQLLIKNGLAFADKRVKDYMTPRSVMEAIGCNELLGPLVLDNLHKTGHTHFPVMDGDIDHLVGILHIYSLFTLENKKSLLVKDVMEPRVFYIHEDQTLEDALAACIKYRRHLLVVVNEYRETVGVITIEDAIIQLTGRKIIDQFAEHDNLRAVAERNPRGNNQPKSHVDV